MRWPAHWCDTSRLDRPGRGHTDRDRAGVRRTRSARRALVPDSRTEAPAAAAEGIAAAEEMAERTPDSSPGPAGLPADVGTAPRGGAGLRKRRTPHRGHRPDLSWCST